MKLNVGCGLFPRVGWVNIDMNPKTAPNPDVYVGPGKLPFKNESFEAIYCGHVLEHVRWEDLRPLLEDLWHLLKPGGRIGVVGPDILRAREGGYPGSLVHACYGHPDNWDGTGEQHVWTCTEQALVELLTGTFVDVEPVEIRYLDRFWPAINNDWWQCAVTARKQGTLVQ